MPRLRPLPALWWVLVALSAQLPTPAQSVPFGGVTFVNKGLVGAGRVDAATRDKLGETFGSLSGTLYALPDRGYTKAGVTTNYRPRRQKFSVTFRPDTSGSSKQDQIAFTLTETLLLAELNGVSLTGMDPSATTAGTRAGFPTLPQAFNSGISLDAEGLAILTDGTFFVSDEYGPYLYRFSAEGTMQSAIRPPEALVPKRNNQDSFSSDSPAAGQPAASPSQPSTGRANNKGLEGLSLSADGRTLYALMQAATRQDTGSGLSRNARMLRYDVTNPAAPVFTGEWVLPLPLYTDGGSQQVAEAHELVALDTRRFLVLAHDGNGRGSTTTKSLYRAILIYDIGNATNIAGAATDSLSTPLAPNGVLASNITPATSVVLVDINDSAQLSKFGLNNSSNDDSNTLSDSWESLALVPALDATTPDDYFLLVGNDNNYSTSNGLQAGSSFNASPNIDSMVLAYRLTLPGTVAVPGIITQPAGSTVAAGSTAVFSATALNALTYQWQRDGVAIPGETSRTLVVAATRLSDAANYSVIARNASGSIVSSPAALSVVNVAPADVGRLTNLSILTPLAAGETMTMGVVLGGAGSNGPKPLLVRAAGPSLAQLGVTGFLPDPTMTLNYTTPSPAVVKASNNDWGGGTALSSAFASVGAFPYASANSKDAALYLNGPTALDAGNYTVEVSSFVSGGTGTVIAELYDATPASAFTATTPRLINVSVLKQVSATGTLTAGFVVGGTTAKTVLIRAIGPRLALAPFSIQGAMPDPQLTLVNISLPPAVTVASNNDWAGDAALVQTGGRVGAFALTDSTSKDAMLLVMLAPGNYTAQVTPASGTAGGTVIVEVYEVP